MASSVAFGVLCACVMVGSMWAFRMPDSCTGPEDCLSDECCVVGMERYSVPRCEKLGQIGATCRPYNEPENLTLWYPQSGGVGSVQQSNHATYTLFCPCTNGLQCTEARCQPATLGDHIGNDLAGADEDYE